MSKIFKKNITAWHQEKSGSDFVFLWKRTCPISVLSYSSPMVLLDVHMSDISKFQRVSAWYRSNLIAPSPPAKKLLRTDNNTFELVFHSTIYGLDYLLFPNLDKPRLQTANYHCIHCVDKTLFPFQRNNNYNFIHI